MEQRHQVQESCLYQKPLFLYFIYLLGETLRFNSQLTGGSVQFELLILVFRTIEIGSNCKEPDGTTRQPEF